MVHIKIDVGKKRRIGRQGVSSEVRGKPKVYGVPEVKGEKRGRCDPWPNAADRSIRRELTLEGLSTPRSLETLDEGGVVEWME